jgi:hypothetical protein
MPNADHDPLDPRFDRQLKAALDRITPPASSARYAERAMAGLRPWRVAPMVVAGSAACLLALTAAFTTGSPNPVVWTQRAASTIESVRHAPETSPSPNPSEPAHATPHSTTAAPGQHPEHEASPSPRTTERPDGSPRPEHSESPNPTGDRFGPSPRPSPRPSPWPSPWPPPSPRNH